MTVDLTPTRLSVLALPRVSADDVALLGRIAGGDTQALAALYARHAGAMLGLALRMLRDRAAAEDLVHDAFLEIWRCAADFDAARGSPRAWLMVRLRSRALDRLRSAARRRVVSMEDAPRALQDLPVPAVHPASAEEVGVRMSLAALPPEHRAVLELGYFSGLSAAEIAERLAIPVGTVKSRTAAALSRLRQTYGPPRGGNL